ncbi:unnamed protein product, partial [Vitis vinifera]
MGFLLLLSRLTKQILVKSQTRSPFLLMFNVQSRFKNIIFEFIWLTLDMGTLAIDDDIAGSDLYLALGLKELGKGVIGTPRVLLLLSSLLERSVQKNETLLETAQIKDAITIFHGSRAPTLSVRQYIDRIFKYSGCSPSCFVVAHIYVDRFLQHTDAHLTSLNVHRLLITSVMVAAKFIDDAFFNNAYYAKVGGLLFTIGQRSCWRAAD